VNADDLDARLSSWLRTRVGVIGGRRVIAVDGKTMRGARPGPHLLAAPDQASGVVVGQRRCRTSPTRSPPWGTCSPPGPGRGGRHRRRHGTPGGTSPSGSAAAAPT